jgi:mucin-19
LLDASDKIGRDVSLDGNRLAAGAFLDDGTGSSVKTDAGAVYLFTFDDNVFTSGALASIIGSGYTDTTTRNDIDISSILDVSDVFGDSVSLSGTNLAAGAQLDDGSGNSGSNNYGAVHLFKFTSSTFSGGALDSTIGSGYTGGSNVNLALDTDDFFGDAVSFNNNRLAVGAAKDDGQDGATTDVGSVYLFSLDEDPILDAVFSLRHDKDITISTSTLATLLATPTNVTLQASNDITISDALTVSNSSGDGGNLILQAGRSIIINANITTDNGDLTLIANDLLANGVVDSDRESGSAVITMASGKSIDAGTGDVTLELRNGTGKTNTTSGDIGSSSDAITISANSLTSINSGGDIFTNFTSTVATAVTTFTDTTTSTSSSSVTTSMTSTTTATTTTGDQATFSDAFGVTLTTDQVATINENLDQGKQSTLIDDFTELASGKGC